MEFFELTTKDGHRITVGRAWVETVTDDPLIISLTGATGIVKCVLNLSGGGALGVQEDYDLVLSYLGARRLV